MGRTGTSQVKRDLAQDPYGGVGSVYTKTIFSQKTRTVATPEGF